MMPKVEIRDRLFYLMKINPKIKEELIKASDEDDKRIEREKQKQRRQERDRDDGMSM